MKHLFQDWDAFTAACNAVSHIVVLADYDGTLTPIVGKPADAILSASVREKLNMLARKPRFDLGIITGRELEEIKMLAGISGIYYSGNHGLEMEGPGLEYNGPAKAIFIGVAISEMAEKIQEVLADVQGVYIQDKGLSLSVHYRQAALENEERIEAAVKQATADWVKAGKIQVYPMKKLWEIRPQIAWNKGKAVQSIRDEVKKKLKLKALLTVFLGDDTTDEDAFKVLRSPDGWGIYVGEENHKSTAEFYLASPAEVDEFLARLLEI